MAAGTANDFFHTFSNFISGKNILSNLLMSILPCIVRILWQNIQKLVTELHLAVLRNKKGEMLGAEALPMAKVMRKEARHTQRWDQASGVPLEILEHLPTKPESAYSLLCTFTYTSDFTVGCPPPPLSEKELNYSSS